MYRYLGCVLRWEYVFDFHSAESSWCSVLAGKATRQFHQTSYTIKLETKCHREVHQPVITPQEKRDFFSVLALICLRYRCNFRLVSHVLRMASYVLNENNTCRWKVFVENEEKFFGGRKEVGYENMKLMLWGDFS